MGVFQYYKMGKKYIDNIMTPEQYQKMKKDKTNQKKNNENKHR